MSQWPLIRVTAAPTRDAVVRFDCNRDRLGAEVAVVADGWSIGTPSLSGDPDALGVEYGPRQVTFTQRITAHKSIALRLQAELARELLRDDSWLMFQLSAGSAPVWFRGLRFEPGELSFEHVRNDSHTDVWHVGVVLDAEPFAYGERVTMPTVTVGNSDASENFLRTTLPAVTGDAPTPLRVKALMTNSTYGAGVGSEWALAVCSGNGPQPVLSPVGPPADDWGVVSGTASEAANADYLNGYYIQLNLGSGDAEIQGLLPTVARGRYKVLVHATGIPDAVETTFTFGQYVASGVVWADPVVRIVDGQDYGGRSWVDLGEHSFPFGQRLPDDVTTPTFDVDIRIAASGDDTIRIDEVVLLPVEGDGTDSATFLGSEFTYWSPGADRSGTWDGSAGTGGVAWVVNGSGQLLGTTVRDHGSYPVADPGAAVNELWVFPTNAGLIAASAITSRPAAWTLEVSYYPLHLYIGGA